MKRTGKAEMSMIKMEAKRARLLAIKALFRIRRYQQRQRKEFVNSKRRVWNWWLKPFILFRLTTPYTNQEVIRQLDENKSLGNLQWRINLAMPPIHEEDYENCYKILILAKDAMKQREKKIWLTKVDFAYLMGISQYW